MPIYKVQGPDGRVYSFEGPEGASESDVIGFAQKHFSQASESQGVKGNDAGPLASAVYGFNSMVPFGNKITSAMGAGIAKGLGAEESFSDLYRQAFADEEATAENNPLANLAGMGVGIAPALMMSSTAGASNLPANMGKARKTINEIPKAIESVGNFIRGSKTGIKALPGQAVRSTAVAAPSFALFGAGEAEPGKELEGAAEGAQLSMLFGPALPALGAAAKGVGNVLSPTLDPAVAKLALEARKMGIPLSMDQLSPTRFRSTLQKVSQEVPLSGVDEFQGTQNKEWNRLIARTLGLDTDDLGPEAIQQFIQNANQKFGSATQGRTILFGQKDLQKLADIPANAKSKISNDLVNIVQNNVDAFLNNSEFRFPQAGVPGGRVIPGEKLASLRSQLIADLPKIQGGAKEQVANIIEVIDDVVGREIGPEQAAILKEARKEWRNFKTLEPLLEASTDGSIQPTALINRVKANPYIKASRTETGDDDLVTLARIGKQFMGKKGGSDTFQKVALGTGLGATAMGVLADPILAATTGALAGGAMMANRGLQKANQSQKLIDRSIQKSLKEEQRLLKAQQQRLLKGKK